MGQDVPHGLGQNRVFIFRETQGVFQRGMGIDGETHFWGRGSRLIGVRSRTIAQGPLHRPVTNTTTNISVNVNKQLHEIQAHSLKRLCQKSLQHNDQLRNSQVRTPSHSSRDRDNEKRLGSSHIPLHKPLKHRCARRLMSILAMTVKQTFAKMVSLSRGCRGHDTIQRSGRPSLGSPDSQRGCCPLSLAHSRV